MRSALGIFGIVAGLINVALVARYGFVTSDTTIDGGIAAFYFAIIAIGGIGGPAVAVHFAAKRRGVWGIIFGFIAIVSLCANVVNSLGALAGRSDKTQAERVKAQESTRDDRTQLARITAERASMTFSPASEASVLAARDAVASAETIRQRECGNGDPKQRGPKCRERETEEQTRRELLAAVLANKALTDKATKLDADAAALRARLDRATPVQSVDPLADSISKLVNLPTEVAAAWQKASVVIVVELLIACALIAFELLGSEQKTAQAAEAKAPVAPEIEAERRDNIVPMVSSSSLVGRYMLARLSRAVGARVRLSDVYSDLSSWCAEQVPPMACPIGRTVYCVDVKLTDAALRVA